MSGIIRNARTCSISGATLILIQCYSIFRLALLDTKYILKGSPAGFIMASLNSVEHLGLDYLREYDWHN